MSLLSRRTLLGAALGGGGLLAAAAAGPAAAATGDAGPVLNAEEHGAVGDGVTDDSAALNAAIRSLADDGGGVLHLPSGVYLLRSSLVLRSGVSVVSGAAGHGYLPAGRASAVVLAAGAGLIGAVVDTPDDAVIGAHLAGVDVRGGGASAGVRIRHGSWCSVTRTSVDDCSGPGVVVDAGMACVLEDLLLTNCVQDHGTSRVTGAIDVDGTDHYLTRCEASCSLRARTSADKRVVGIALRGANHFASDCVGEYSDVGVAVGATSCRFTNVRADTNFGDGFRISGGANAFAACTAAGNSQDASGQDDGWVVTGSGNTFAACNVVTSPGTQVRYGFRDTVNTRDARDRNTYAACTVDEAASGAWQLEGYLGSSPAVPPNAIRPASGATSIDVTQATLVVLFDYTAPTTVTAFTGGVNGQTIRLLGTAQVVVAAGASIRTTTGLPIAMAADRVVTLTHYNGVWYQSD